MLAEPRRRRRTTCALCGARVVGGRLCAGCEEEYEASSEFARAVAQEEVAVADFVARRRGEKGARK